MKAELLMVVMFNNSKQVLTILIPKGWNDYR